MLYEARLMRYEEKGREQGKAEGANNSKIEIAKNMLKDNEPIEKIIKYTGLSEKKIIKIQKEL